jgi:hypothetical protein
LIPNAQLGKTACTIANQKVLVKKSGSGFVPCAQLSTMAARKANCPVLAGLMVMLYGFNWMDWEMISVENSPHGMDVLDIVHDHRT